MNNTFSQIYKNYSDKTIAMIYKQYSNESEVFVEGFGDGANAETHFRDGWKCDIIYSDKNVLTCEDITTFTASAGKKFTKLIWYK